MKRWDHSSTFGNFILLELETQSGVQVVLESPFLRIGPQIRPSWLCQSTLRCWYGVVDRQLYMCRLVNMNVLSTIDVDSLATVRAHYKVTGVKSHRLCLTIRVIPFYPFLNKYSGPFEPINKFFFVFLLNL